MTLERGILVRGQIHESTSGQPVAGAIVVYRPKRKNNPMFKEDLFAIGGLPGAFGSQWRRRLRSRSPALPGPGHLLVKGPNSDFVPVRTSEGELEDDAPGGARLYPDGLLALNLDASAKVADVSDSTPARRHARGPCRRSGRAGRAEGDDLLRGD